MLKLRRLAEWRWRRVRAPRRKAEDAAREACKAAGMQPTASDDIARREWPRRRPRRAVPRRPCSRAALISTDGRRARRVATIPRA